MEEKQEQAKKLLKQPRLLGAPQTKKQFFIMLGNMMAKSLLMKLIISVIFGAAVFVFNVYLISFVNDTIWLKDLTPAFVAAVTNLCQNNTYTHINWLNSSLFWFMAPSAFFILLMGLIRGPKKLGARLADRAKRFVASITSAPQSTNFTLLLLAAALIIALSVLFMNSFTALVAIPWLFLFSARQGKGLILTFLRASKNDRVKSSLKRGSVISSELNESRAFALSDGAIIGFLIGGLLNLFGKPASLYVGMPLAGIVLGLAVASLFFSKGKMHTAMLFALIGGSAMLLCAGPLAVTVMADDGGWTESGRNLWDLLKNAGTGTMLTGCLPVWLTSAWAFFSSTIDSMDEWLLSQMNKLRDYIKSDEGQGLIDRFVNTVDDVRQTVEGWAQKGFDAVRDSWNNNQIGDVLADLGATLMDKWGGLLDHADKTWAPDVVAGAADAIKTLVDSGQQLSGPIGEILDTTDAAVQDVFDWVAQNPDLPAAKEILKNIMETLYQQTAGTVDFLQKNVTDPLMDMVNSQGFKDFLSNVGKLVFGGDPSCPGVPIVPPPVGPIVPPQVGPIVPPQVEPIVPPQVGPIVPPQVGPIVPPQVGPIVPPQVGPIVPPQVGPIVPPQVGPIVPPQVGPIETQPGELIVDFEPPSEPIAIPFEPGESIAPPVRPVKPPVRPFKPLVKPVKPPVEPVVPPVEPVVPPVEPVVPPVEPVVPPVEPVVPPVEPVVPPVEPVVPPVEPVVPPVEPVVPPVEPVVPPVEPVVPPVEPVVPPVEPVVPPVEPVVPPVEPVVPPVEPVVPPVEPVVPPVEPVVPPVEPVVPPVEPVVPPVEPVVPPVEPVVPPVEPVVPPVEPVVPPVEPVVPPVEPVVPPVEPVVPPVEPVVPPVEPVVPPVEPVVPPVEPVVPPVEPVVPPVEPVVPPVEPVVPPVEPVVPPVEPVVPPVEPVVPPVEPVVPPVEPVVPPVEPVVPSVKPVGPSVKPVGPSVKPVGPSVKPVGPSVKPVGPSVKPVGPSVKPVGPSVKPVGPSVKPVGPSVKPVGPSAEPVVTMPVQPHNNPNPTSIVPSKTPIHGNVPTIAPPAAYVPNQPQMLDNSVKPAIEGAIPNISDNAVIVGASVIGLAGIALVGAGIAVAASDHKQEEPSQSAPDALCLNCGTALKGLFCTECGVPASKPTLSYCTNCGNLMNGNLCDNCGTTLQ